MSLDTDISIWLSLVFIVGGLYVLAKSADMFVGAAEKIARHFGLSPLVVGMVIIGFGTSAPELAVSAISASGGHSNLSLGNAYGSCVFNIGAILGITALIWPIRVKPSVNWFAVPLLALITVLSWVVVGDGEFERTNGIVLLCAFVVLLPLYCWFDQRNGETAGSAAQDRRAPPPSSAAHGGLWREWCMLIAGLSLLVTSSHVLVWGSVDFSRDVLHVSELVIGLTIVAAGTSLPELASAIVSARKGENEFVIGNIIGSNFFNTLAVVGLAGTISPFSDFGENIIRRDLPSMLAFTLLIAVFGVNLRHPKQPGCITRWKGVVWLLLFLVYVIWMIAGEVK